MHIYIDITVNFLCINIVLTLITHWIHIELFILGLNATLKRPLRVKYASNMYNISTEINNPPIDKTYNGYIHDGEIFESNTNRKILHINGVKRHLGF